MCTIDGDCGGSGGGGGGGWLGVVGIWKAVHLRTCDIVLGILEIVNNQFILKSNVARME